MPFGHQRLCNVLWSDESKFNWNFKDERRRVWRQNKRTYQGWCVTEHRIFHWNMWKSSTGLQDHWSSYWAIKPLQISFHISTNTTYHNQFDQLSLKFVIFYSLAFLHFRMYFQIKSTSSSHGKTLMELFIQSLNTQFSQIIDRLSVVDSCLKWNKNEVNKIWNAF